MPTAITISAVDTGADTLTATGHGLLTGDRFRVRNVDGALPTGLAAVTSYFAIRLDADTLKVATTSANALAGTAINLTGAGSGTNTIEYGLPYVEPRVAAPGGQIESADDNATWASLTALHALLTGQSQAVWSGVTLAGALNTGGPLTVAGTLTQSSVISPAALASGDTDDWNPTGLSTASMIRVTTDAGHSTLRSLAGGSANRRITLVNIGLSNGNLVLAHDGGGTGSNRFFLPAAASLTIRPYGCAEIWYDDALSRWRVLSAVL